MSGLTHQRLQHGEAHQDVIDNFFAGLVHVRRSLGDCAINAMLARQLLDEAVHE